MNTNNILFMVISENILFSYGAIMQSYDASEFVFREGTISKFYFQIKSGFVKLNNFTEKGNEFIHGIPFDGHCFGESYLFTEIPYGISAITMTKCEIIKLEKADFQKMLSEMPDLFPILYKYTSERFHFRYLMSSLLSESNPVKRITKFLDFVKTRFGCKAEFSFKVPYTRNQIASFTGMRVETIIRAIKKMKQEGKLLVKEGKIYY